MTAQAQTTTSFLLIDGSLLAAADIPVPAPDDRPAWLTQVYDDRAAAVSPLLIDIDAAQATGACAQMMALANALHPQLHASLIDTTLSHAELTHHLRHFIMIGTADKNAYTLRFADCTVLPILATVFTPEQWAALVSPIARWCVHGRDGALLALPQADGALTLSPPLVLTDDQLYALAEAAAPSVMLAHIRGMRHGAALPGSAADQHRWANDARDLWRGAGNADDIVLRWLTSAALDTYGEVLRLRGLPALLASADRGAIRDGLLAAVGDHRDEPERRPQ